MITSNIVSTTVYTAQMTLKMVTDMLENDLNITVSQDKIREALPLLVNSLQTFAAKKNIKARRGFFIDWHYKDKRGFEVGFSYIAHYATEVIYDVLVNRKKVKFNIDEINALTNKLMRTQGLEKSPAMVQAYAIAKERNAAHIQLYKHAESFDAGHAEAIRPIYEGLCIGPNGELHSRWPRKGACILALETAGVIFQLLDL